MLCSSTGMHFITKKRSKAIKCWHKQTGTKDFSNAITTHYDAGAVNFLIKCYLWQTAVQIALHHSHNDTNTKLKTYSIKIEWNKI